MKTHILPAIKLTLGTLILFTVLYPALVWAFAQISPNRGKGEIVQYNGHTYYSNIGQSFTEDQYFWSRPSAVDYNASGSGASNKGPSNKEYLEAVQTRIETFMQHNPGIKKSDIPVDLVTASGSGLDPNISVQAAKVQIQRIATVRKLALSEVEQLVNQQIEKPLWGLLGPEKINVLKLNIALDQRSKK